MTKYQVLVDTVIDGSVAPAGTTIDTTAKIAYRLEREQIIERLESEWPMIIKPGRTEPLKDILIFTPVYRLEAETVAALLNLEFDGALSLLFQKDNPDDAPTDGGRANHLHQYQRGRRQFLAGPYDAMLVIESDIIPPADTIRRLEDLHAACAYGVYRFRVSNVINVFERYPEKNGKPARNMGESLSVKPHLLKRAVSLGQYPCSGAGLGCVLIRRPVLEALDFRMEDTHGAHCDTFFNRDVLSGGWSQWADMGVICAHKDEEGRILWPELPSLNSRISTAARTSG